MEDVTVTISGYEKFKGRKDVQNPNWFKMSNRLLEDPDFYAFTHEEILVWVQILAVSSQKQSPSVTLNLEHMKRVCRLSPEAVMSAIEKLRAKKILSCVPIKKKARTPTLRGRDARIEEKREEERRREEIRKPAAPVAVTAPPVGKNLVAHYCEVFKTRYETNPVIRPQDAKLLKTFGESAGESRAKELLSAYLAMSNSWFLTKHHDIQTFHQNLNAVQNYLANGKTITRADAFNGEADEALKNQIERLTGGKT